MKRYANNALFYSILAMVGGVFYREFTKLSGFVGETTLSVVHTHYFLLGMVIFLLLLLPFLLPLPHPSVLLNQNHIPRIRTAYPLP